MANPAKTHYLDVYNESRKLHDQKKWKNCIALCHHNLSDDSMPRFFVTKTLVLLTGAVDDWWRVEEYWLAAENVFRRVRATQEASSAPPLSTDVEECMTELRQELDEMLEWQADDTPEHTVNSPLTFVGAQVPPRPGSLKDFLQAHRTKAEEEARAAIDTDIEGATEVGMKVDDGVHAEIPGEDMVDVDDGGDEGSNKGDDNEFALEDAGGVREVEDLCLAMLVHWAGLT